MSELDDLFAEADQISAPKPSVVPLGRKRTGGDFPRSRRIKSKTRDVEYTVTVFDASGFGECECTGFGYRKTCAHLDEYRKQLAEAGILAMHDT